MRNFNEISGKMGLMIILKVTKNQGFTPSLQDTFFEKPQGEEVGSNGTPVPGVLGLMNLEDALNLFK